MLIFIINTVNTVMTNNNFAKFDALLDFRR